MKNLFFLLSLFFLFSCSNEENGNVQNEQEQTKNLQTRTVEFDNEYEYNLVSADYKLNVKVFRDGQNFLNEFAYFDNSTESMIFKVDYVFDTTDETWKLDQQENVLNLANELQDLNLTARQLTGLKFIIEESVLEVFDKANINNINNDYLSGIYYLNSAVDANIRSGESEITGTISPFFLVGKSYFAFQEDMIFNVADLRNDISVFVDNGNNLSLINFIMTTNKTQVNFTELYNYIIPTQKFKDFVSDKKVYKEGDCSTACPIGCGTDWGCCGSYLGCCLLSADICMSHDLKCSKSNCKPIWYCLPGCSPDYGNNRPVTFIMIKFLE